MKKLKTQAAPTSLVCKSPISTISHIVWHANSQGDTEFLSEKFFEITGRPQGKFPTRFWQELLVPEQQIKFSLLWQEALASGKEFTGDFQLLDRDGKWLWFRLTTNPLYGAASGDTKWVGTWAKIEADKLDQIIPFNLNELIADVRSGFQPLAAEKGLAFEIHTDDTAGEQCFSGDPSRISQVLNNLVGHAIKYTADGAICLDISQVIEDKKFRLHFSVSDRALPISKKLVEMMGGQITVDSEEGKESIFKVTIVVDLTSRIEASNRRICW